MHRHRLTPKSWFSFFSPFFSLSFTLSFTALHVHCVRVDLNMHWDLECDKDFSQFIFCQFNRIFSFSFANVLFSSIELMPSPTDFSLTNNYNIHYQRSYVCRCCIHIRTKIHLCILRMMRFSHWHFEIFDWQLRGEFSTVFVYRR